MVIKKLKALGKHIRRSVDQWEANQLIRGSANKLLLRTLFLPDPIDVTIDAPSKKHIRRSVDQWEVHPVRNFRALPFLIKELMLSISNSPRIDAEVF